MIGNQICWSDAGRYVSDGLAASRCGFRQPLGIGAQRVLGGADQIQPVARLLTEPLPAP